MKRRSCRDRDAHDASCVKLREALLEVADDRRAGKRRGCDHPDGEGVFDCEMYDLQAVELGVCEDVVAAWDASRSTSRYKGKVRTWETVDLHGVLFTHVPQRLL